MEWVHVSKDVEAALEEIKTGGDRAAAIVAATFVDDHLSQVIRSSFHQDVGILNSMFRGSGPLGSFSTKIDVAFLTGLFSAECRKELIIIKDIRNLFAHDLKIKSFESQKISTRVANLKRFERKFTITNLNREGFTRSLVYSPETIRPSNTRERYIMACRYYTAILSMLIPGRVQMPDPVF